MKFRGAVVSATDNGDRLDVELQVQQTTAGEYGAHRIVKVGFENTSRARSAFFVGRRVTLEVVPS